MYIALFKALKADPTSINFGELFAALQQGTVDGQENPPDVIASARVQEVQKYMTLWNASYDPIIMTSSRKFWDSLSAGDKEIFAKAAREAMAFQKKLAREKNAELVKSFREKMQVVDLTPKQVEAFRKASAPVYAEYEEILGKDLLEAFGYKNK
jgi:TRAP-type C4-dicarboxylate transport system substrate-binding protein